MGCDGGSIPGRRDLVKQRASTKAAEAVVAETASSRWHVCAISQERLVAPIVVCRLGHLYNKDALIQQHLLSKSRSPQFAHIRSLSDVIELKFHPADTSDDGGADSPVFQCPVTMLIGNGKYRFHVSRACGCLVSERALKETNSSTCLMCQKALGEPTGSDDAIERLFIVVNPTSNEERERLRHRMEQDLANAPDAHRKKKNKKRKNGDAEDDKKSQADSSSKKRNAATSSKSEAYASIFTSSKTHSNPNTIKNTLFGHV
ncbi:Replication termination factor 2 [Plasmodiophora brassicae]|uniref:Uncharacterized protein n=1 Tax=Plasmodiophora brassicae TaxID=37360 RepID=A0A0G4ITV6_PLABS|nr:hypothetical protein PBRA_006685 [Plasmodiophora brassicae]SPQ95802.1 unnamed protein product [Plasmodiophora brassicae]